MYILKTDERIPFMYAFFVHKKTNDSPERLGFYFDEKSLSLLGKNFEKDYPWISRIEEIEDNDPVTFAEYTIVSKLAAPKPAGMLMRLADPDKIQFERPYLIAMLIMHLLRLQNAHMRRQGDHEDAHNSHQQLIFLELIPHMETFSLRVSADKRFVNFWKKIASRSEKDAIKGEYAENVEKTVERMSCAFGKDSKEVGCAWLSENNKYGLAVGSHKIFLTEELCERGCELDGLNALEALAFIAALSRMQIDYSVLYRGTLSFKH